MCFIYPDQAVLTARENPVILAFDRRVEAFLEPGKPVSQSGAKTYPTLIQAQDGLDLLESFYNHVEQLQAGVVCVN